MDEIVAPGLDGRKGAGNVLKILPSLEMRLNYQPVLEFLDLPF
jgi:hypothetical protein